MLLVIAACSGPAAPPSVTQPPAPQSQPLVIAADEGNGSSKPQALAVDASRALVPGERSVAPARVYFVGKFGGAAVTRLGQLDVPGGSTTIFPLAGIDGGASGSLTAWFSTDRSQLLVLGRTTADKLELHVYDLSAPQQTPRILYAAQTPDVRHNGAALLSPDGKLVVFSASIEGGHNALYVVPARGGVAPRRVGPLTTIGRYAWAPGEPATLVYLYVSEAGRTLWSIDAMRPDARPVQLASSAVGWNYDFDASGNVVFAWAPGPPGIEGLEGLEGTPYAVPVGGGKPRKLASTIANTIAASPDRKQIAIGGTDGSVGLLDSQGVRTLATLPEPYVASITWSDDSKQLAVRGCPRGSDGGCMLYVMLASGNVQPVRMFGGAFAATFTPDSRMLLAVSDVVAPMQRELYGTADLATANPDPAVTRLQDAPDGYIYYCLSRPLP